jgi:hypothetical protein
LQVKLLIHPQTQQQDREPEPEPGNTLRSVLATFCQLFATCQKTKHARQKIGNRDDPAPEIRIASLRTPSDRREKTNHRKKPRFPTSIEEEFCREQIMNRV